MGVTLGIDVGGSTTKVVGVENGELVGTLQVRAEDQITSLFGAIGNYLRKYSLSLQDVVNVALTGVGSSFIDEPIYGIETHKVNEFSAVGYGALRLAGLNEALVVSMGTGTAFVRASRDGIYHLGGSGLGGGTILGLASKMLGKNDIDAILALAENGNLENIDLSVRDIIGGDIPSLPKNLTASNFGRIRSTATESDLALGIINMVFQTVGMLAVFVSQNDTLSDVVMTGTLTMFPQAKDVQSAFSGLSHLRFIIPPNAVYATAIGAACAKEETLS